MRGALPSGLAAVAWVFLAWSIASSLWYYPHSLSYFNEVVGGPEHGHEHLLDSSISWGQDLLFLKKWYDEHPEARPLYLATYGLVDPSAVGVEFALPAPLPKDSGQPGPGWYAIDVNYLRGSRRPAPNGKGSQKALWRGSADLQYFNALEPVARIGYSSLVYQIP